MVKMFNYPELKRQFQDEGIDTIYLVGILRNGFDRATVDFEVEPAIGKGLHSDCYHIRVFDGKGREKLVFLKRPSARIGQGLYTLAEITEDPANMSAIKEHRILEKLGRDYVYDLRTNPPQILMPRREKSLDAVLLDLFERYRNASPEKQGTIAKEVVGVYKDVTTKLLETYILLRGFYPEEVVGTPDAAFDVNAVKERVREYFFHTFKLIRPDEDDKTGWDLSRWLSEYVNPALEELSPVYEALGKRQKLLHGDFRPENVLVDRADLLYKAEYYIHDWSNAKFGPLHLDLGRMYLAYEFEVFELPPEQRARMHRMFQRAIVDNTLIEEEQKNKKDEIDLGGSNPSKLLLDKSFEEGHARESLLWACLRDIGIPALMMVNSPERYEEFVSAKGDLGDLYEPQSYLRFNLSKLARLCKRFGYSKTENAVNYLLGNADMNVRRAVASSSLSS